MLKKIISQEDNKKKMVSVQTQIDLPETSKLKSVHRWSVSAQTKMDAEETRCQSKPVHQTIVTQTKMNAEETRHQSKPGKNQDNISEEFQ